MQGPHQVAQKSTNTTFPLREPWSKGEPSTIVPLISIVLPGSDRRRTIPSKLLAISTMVGSLLLESTLLSSVKDLHAALGSICSCWLASILANMTIFL